MNKSIISAPHKDFEDIKKIDENGIEYWEARKLMPLLNYTDWRNFEKVIRKAKTSCKKSGQSVENHFVDVNKMVSIGSSTERSVNDYKLSRYACYLIAQNGDPKKKEIANAQTYFAIQARKQELFEHLEEGEKRIYIRDQVKDHNKQLSATAKEAGVINFGRFNNAGYMGLYGLKSIDVKKKKGIGKDDLLDRAGTTELAANLFRITQTDEKLRNEKVRGQFLADETHRQVGTKVRQTISELGGTMPENLPAETHIKKIERQQRKLLESNKKQIRG